MDVAGRKSLLLVEDEALIAMTEKAFLQREGYEVVHALNGERALEFVAERSFDLVLMDIDLGRGIDGAETARRILALRPQPLAFLSSHSDQETVAKTETITSFGYILKGSGNLVLAAAIKMALRLARSKEESELAEARLQAIIDSTGDLIWSVDLEHFGLGTFNQGLVDYFQSKRGITIKEGDTPADLFPPGDYVERWRGYYRQALESGSFSTEYLTYSGTKILSLTINRMVKAGTVVGLSIFGKDVTEEQRMQREIVALEERFAEAFRNSAAAMSVARLAIDTQIVDCNEAYEAITGYQRDEVLGRSSAELELFADPGVREELLGRLRREGRTKTETIRLRRKDGRILDVSFSSVLVHIDGEPHVITSFFSLDEHCA